ncbi:MAG TPA: HEAT repeat domain-containing protein [Methanoregula sp.]|nr:HEAT repeat domain-containing protein [Methanoregula sp.]
MTKSEIPAMIQEKNVDGLIHVLAVTNPDLQTAAVHALGKLGTIATDPLLEAAKNKKNRLYRLGAISALAEIKDRRSVPHLIQMLNDPGSEIRWQVTIALGEFDDPVIIPSLVSALRDRDKYVRYGAAASLKKTGYVPSDPDEAVWYYAGFQDWDKLQDRSISALPPLVFLLDDPDREIRLNAIKVLSKRAEPAAAPALIQSLGDEDRDVRWNAMFAAERCGVPQSELPRGLYSRPHVKKNPLIAGFLNFLLPGLGYGYIGKWWGIMIFQIDITVTVWLFKIRGEADTYSLLFPIYLLLAIHAWYITKRLPEEPP